MKPCGRRLLSGIIQRGSILFAASLVLVILSSTASYAGFSHEGFGFEGLVRRYWVYQPPDFEPNMPLVFVLHGNMQSGEVIMQYTVMHEVADTTGFVVVYPDAAGPGFNSGLEGYPGLPPLPDVNDVGFIYALIDTIYAHYDIDKHRIYCCGFGNGGIMTYRLLGEIGYRFAAVASVSGSLTDGTIVNFDEISPKPILHCHGTADDVAYYDGDIANLWSVEETIDFWLDKNGCSDEADTFPVPDIDPTDGSTVEKISYTDCSENSCLIFYKILGGGHSWPGHTGNMDIHASSEIWNFCKDYEAVSGEDSPGSTPTHIHLSQISPNPFRSMTTIAFDLPRIGDVSVSVSDISGRTVMTDALGIMDAGSYRYLFNGSELPSGAYFFRLDAEPHSAVKPMVLVK